MPYVQVWVEETECGPCEECERRKDDEERADADLVLIMSEWYRAKRYEDYAVFGEFLESLRPRLWHHAVYGPRRRPVASPPKAS